jgi:hypothetical protein
MEKLRSAFHSEKSLRSMITCELCVQRIRWERFAVEYDVSEQRVWIFYQAIIAGILISTGHALAHAEMVSIFNFGSTYGIERPSIMKGLDAMIGFYIQARCLDRLPPPDSSDRCDSPHSIRRACIGSR